LLALYSGGDLGWWDRMRVSLHVRDCAECSEAVELFCVNREALRAQAGELPAGIDWNRLSTEMVANIRVGLAAGRCVEQRRPALVAHRFRPAAVVASIAALFVGGWWLSVSSDPGLHVSTAMQFRQVLHALQRTPAAQSVDNAVTVGSTQDGLEVKQNGAVLRIGHPGAAPALVTASTAGSVRARYIDEDTGQVTITNVYSQ
jgi:hypothetical protein